MTHTPGPWEVRYANNLTAIVTPKGEMQLSLHGIYDGLKPLSVSLQEWQANAALIAAAPAMYEALKTLLDAFDTDDAHQPSTEEAGRIIDATLTTIRLAEGRG